MHDWKRGGLAGSVGLALLLGGCAAGMDPEVAATVNGEPVPADLLQVEWQRMRNDPGFTEQLREDPQGRYQALIQGQLLSALIQSELVEQAAAELGVEAGPAEVARQRDVAYADLGGEAVFHRAREQAGYSPEQMDAEFEEAALRQAVADEVAGDVEVTEDEIAARYAEAAAGRFGPSVTARHILTDTEDAAAAALERLTAGEDFAAVAADVSLDPGTAGHGGELGEITRGETVAAFEAAAYAAEVGALAGPVRSPLGFHVIQVTSRRDEPRPLAEVADDLREELELAEAAEAFDGFISRRAAEAEVAVNPRYGEWSQRAGAVVAVDTLPAAQLDDATAAPDLDAADPDLDEADAAADPDLGEGDADKAEATAEPVGDTSGAQ